MINNMDFRNNIRINKPKANLSFGSLKQEKFDRIFPAFLENTDEKDQMTNGMEDVFLALKKSDEWSNKKEIKVMDLGCGDGFTSSKIYAMIQKFFPDLKLKVEAFDNNRQQLLGFLSRFSKSESINVKTQEADVFSRISQGEDDLVIASHSLYHAPVDNLKEIIPAMYASTSHQGLTIISLLKDTSDFSVIQRKFGRFVTSEGETNPVSVELKDIKDVIQSSSKIKPNSLAKSYEAYVYFPKIDGGFETFKNWQLHAQKEPAPNKECQLTLDLLEFIVHGDFDKLRKANRLDSFLKAIEKMFAKNGCSAEGKPRINFNGENVFLFGSKIVDIIRRR